MPSLKKPVLEGFLFSLFARKMNNNLMVKYGKKIFSILVLLVVAAAGLQAQEFNARVTVMAQQVGSSVNKSIFNTLQTQLANFINNRRWTNDVFQPQERISCNFLLNITSANDQGFCKGILTVQAARPVYNTSYQSPLLNYQDNDIVFNYVPNQNLEFNPSRVSGNDPLSSNLTAVFAFYLNIILGLHYDSFSQNGGLVYFKNAQNIVNAAPQASDITGWQSFNGLRNRYWMSENVLNPRYSVIPGFIYSYFRKGLDGLYENQNTASANVLDALSQLQEMNRLNPNTMFVQLFTQGRYQELSGIFKNAQPDTKNTAKQVLMQLDASNATKYDSGL